MTARSRPPTGGDGEKGVFARTPTPLPACMRAALKGSWFSLMDSKECTEGVKANGSCGEQDLGKEEEWLLASSPLGVPDSRERRI